MQNKDQWKRKWKVAAGIGIAAALGVTGIAVAGPGEVPSRSTPITLQQQVLAGSSASTTLPWTMSTSGAVTSASSSTTLPSTSIPGQDDADCLPGVSCLDSADCLPGASCLDSADCAPGVSCLDSADVAPPVDAALDSADCLPGTPCLDSADVAPAGSSDSVDAADSSVDS
jgi:hypothetical protein